MKRISAIALICFCVCFLFSCRGEIPKNIHRDSGNSDSNGQTVTAFMENEVSDSLNYTSESDPGEEANLSSVPEVSGRDLLKMKGVYFSTAGECSLCHQNVIDAKGNNVSPDQDWRSSMMANAARDPYFLATVRDEINQHPAYQEAIEEECAECHLPMGARTAEWTEETGAILTNGLLDEQNPYSMLAFDGVSCTLCHQIMETGLGDDKSFSGGYQVDSLGISGERSLYGPYDISENLALIMQRASGFVPMQGNQIQSAALCGSCHTLYTHLTTETGLTDGHAFPEQTTYLEWEHSQYRETSPCQDCHMPIAVGEVKTSIMSDELKFPVLRHQFTGANRFMLEVLRRNAEKLEVTAEETHLDSRIEDIEELLENRTGKLSTSIQRNADQMEISITINNFAGHKFPTGYPSRRAWLHVVVFAQEGHVLFESGGWDRDGSIRGNDNDFDATLYEQHYDLITNQEEVQIYESIMVDFYRQVTTGIMSASDYVKDNRLLPFGFDKNAAHKDFAPRGDASQDGNFTAGEDRILYVIDLGQYTGKLDIKVELLYQSISFRWLEKFSKSDTEEGVVLIQSIGDIVNAPVVIDSISTTVP